ncbi:hypothetical protein WM40_06925 [Robbsia andropogonis]|uniref:Type III secretion system chaperone n=1 Tax=Robbsia andropogonis TaxID=28092 RepID=A0A0F5K3W2_9BURK|nr:type III secretion system chaperone [Robbsia andropogonis]KKB64222.1 hypothetical protein WM40_06925 [Robbsia andropogonis]MCP1118787.1 type III secretion system chaperone [Robbsia andropogonis]MCP1128254.1 type III secretion system chaperone [Robbsia andropogonis]
MVHTPYLALLEALAHHLPGIDPSSLVQAQSLTIDGRRIDFALEADPQNDTENRMVVRCEVVRLPAPASEAVCRLLLHANNLWAGTRGATLGLRGDRIVIASETARLASLDPDRVVAMLAGLREQAQAWAAELTGMFEHNERLEPHA